ncbi:hypothetical protein Bbelb_007970 [Branchiostoma belcheri]|nr:hypothetical protein Bbelb_007970 [Branchiostoma belcheri]
MAYAMTIAVNFDDKRYHSSRSTRGPPISPCWLRACLRLDLISLANNLISPLSRPVLIGTYGSQTAIAKQTGGITSVGENPRQVSQAFRAWCDGRQRRAFALLRPGKMARFRGSGAAATNDPE